MLEQVRISINLDHLPFATGVPISHELLHAMEKYAILAEGHNFTKQIAAVFAARRGGRDIGEPIIKLEAAMKLLCDAGVDEIRPDEIRAPLANGDAAILSTAAELRRDQGARINQALEQIKQME